MKNKSIEESRFQQGVGVDLHRVSGGVFVFVLAATLLNAAALDKSAHLMEFGLRRNICIALITPVDRLSKTLGLEQFREWIEKVPIRKDKE